MIRALRSAPSSLTILVILLAIFALLAGLYYSLRFGGWAMEGDASSMANAASGMLNSGQLISRGAYTNGYAYPAQLAFTSLISSLDVRDIQLFSSLWVVVVALTAFIAYREFLGSNGAAALGALLLFLQPDFLFYILRGSHEKYIWTFALLMLFLLARSFDYLHKPSRMLAFVGLFYLVFWAFVAGNVYFAASFMSAIMLSFAGGWILSRLGRKNLPPDQVRPETLRRLILISLVCFTLVYIFIHYSYGPALQIYYFFTSMADRIGLLVLSTQDAGTPASYTYFGKAWRSQQAYLALTGGQWLIALVSVAAWVIGLFKLSRLDQKRWLLWLMYSAFGVLLAYGVVADFAGFMTANLQMRMFTPFALLSSPLAADLLANRLRTLRPHMWRLVAIAGVVILTFGSAGAVLKVTNDPTVGNQWFFYSPTELASTDWLEQSKVPQNQVWVDTWAHLPSVFYFWQGERPFVQDQYLYGSPRASARYFLISERNLLRANRSGISLPATYDQNLIYDNGPSQMYHRRPVTLYQR